MTVEHADSVHFALDLDDSVLACEQIHCLVDCGILDDDRSISVFVIFLEVDTQLSYVDLSLYHADTHDVPFCTVQFGLGRLLLNLNLTGKFRGFGGSFRRTSCNSRIIP